MKTGYKVAIGVGLAAIFGGAAYMYFRKPKQDNKDVKDIIEDLTPVVSTTSKVTPTTVTASEILKASPALIAEELRQQVSDKNRNNRVPVQNFTGDFN